jgi:imidazole glycerol-phosphate synthase subunit HisF
MLRPRIIPCLLMRDGGLYKPRQFANPKYVGDPLNAVKIFNEKEVDELVLLDIGVPTENRPNFKLLEKIAVESRMPLCYGGGVTGAQQMCRIVNMGFEKVSVSTAAVRRPRMIRELADAVGSQSVVVTLDVKNDPASGTYAVFTQNGKVKSERDVFDLCAEFVAEGVGELVFNSIDREGMMEGYDLRFAHLISSKFKVPLTFMGGAGNVGHMRELIDTVGVVGAAAGSMFVFKGPFRAVLISYHRP